MRSFHGILACSAILAGGMTAHGAATAYFTASGPQNMGSATNWGTNAERDADTAFAVTFDFTANVAGETDPIILWEAGGSGTGAALVLHGALLYFFAGNSNDDVVSGSHGLTAPTVGVQVVSVFDLNGGTGGNELLSIYVNGVDITTGGAEANTANAWDGGENYSDLGTKVIGSTYRFNSTSLFASGSVVGYDSAYSDPNPPITFAVYQLASGGGPVDNTLENILVPEPSTFAMAGLSCLALLLHRRRG